MRRLSVLAVASLFLVVAAFSTGCARSRIVDRNKVLEAENINQRQKSRTLEGQLRQSHAALDESVAREQQLQHELTEVREDARGGAEARGRLQGVESALDAERSRTAQLQRELSEARKVAARTPAPAPVAAAPTYTGVSPELEAMRRDLQSHLSEYGATGLPVEIRTDRSGQSRVAIVLPDAFPSGKATLAYNPTAVKAVMGVGKMIQDHYPASRVSIEGHTDSDPIKRSSWGTNERLSEARAGAVRDLLENAGVSGGAIATVGVGSTQPLEPGSTTRAKSRNRRVEIFLAPR
jgi:flagellar motor protein MotB